MNKVKLFRRGLLVGLVSQEFHYDESRKKEAFWDKIGVENVSIS
jgi:hypothetical protein